VAFFLRPTLYNSVTQPRFDSGALIADLLRSWGACMRAVLIGAVFSFAFIAISAAGDGVAAIKKRTDIPAQRLETALQRLAQERGLQIVCRSDVVAELRSAGASGNLTQDEAITQLLNGTGLTYHYLNSETITIVPRTAPLKDGHNTQPPAMQNEPTVERAMRDFRVAQVDQGVNPLGAAITPSAKEAVTLQEVVVTAQKREERLQDVPVPVSVINARSLVENNQVLLQDYASSVPGLDLSPTFLGQTQLSLRGVATSNGTPTVGIVVDDLPYGGSSTWTAGDWIPDIDPGDLARIEVLRGPQGTLYGANTMGGLIKYVTIDPSVSGYSARVESGLSDVHNGAQPGFNVRGSANIPLGETLALRVSGYDRQDPGYIDNPKYDLSGVNEVENYGARLSALWQITDTVSLKLSAITQHTKAYGVNDVDVPTAGFPDTVGLKGLQQNYVAGLGGPERKVQVYSAVLKAQFAGLDFISITGYSVNNTLGKLDFSYLFAPLLSSFPSLAGADATPYFSNENVSRVTQEVRLSGTAGSNIEWLVGGFYSHERDSAHSYVQAENTNTGQFVGTFYDNTIVPVFQEYAGFGALTYHFTDRFDIQLGGRESHEQLNLGENVQSGPLAGTSPVIAPPLQSNSNTFTYLATPRLKLSADTMVYARFASGYRPGGPNPPSAGSPSAYAPDKTKTYEVGVKGDFLDRKLSVDASLYYIDWRNIQLGLVNPNTHFNYVGNGARAKSDGVELSLQSHPVSGLTLAAWLAYDDAALTQSFPPGGPGQASGVSGDRLPFTSRWSGNVSLNQDFPLSAQTTGYLGGAISYVGDRQGIFVADPPRQSYPAYTKTDLHAGVKYEDWTFNLYANNVTDRRGVLGGGIGNDPPYAFVYITPRTIGLNISKSW